MGTAAQAGRLALALGASLALAAAGCNRHLEPFDPNEQPRQPDLSKIFPEGAQQAEPAVPAMPPAPGEARGTGPAAGIAAEAPAGAPITGTVRLAPELQGQVPAGAILFIIARHGAGGGPPLAVKRVPSPSFPLAFSVGPEDRMIQAMPFTGPISLSARVDSDGNAMSRSPGDIQGEGEGGPFDPGATGVVILLDQKL
jgi:hypothetical protein